jgi:hypothetical protein
MKADAITGLRGRPEGRRLPDVVQQYTPSQRRGSALPQFFEHQAGVNPHIALRVKLRRLLHALHCRNLRQNLTEKPGLLQQFEGSACSPFGQHLRQFFAHAFGRDLLNFSDVPANGTEGRLLDCEAEPRRETDRSHHPQLVFGKAAIGIADGANHTRVEVLLSADEVQYFAGVVPHQQAIDSEVPSLHVFLRSLRINHAVGMTPVAITKVRTKRGDLYF